MKHNCQNCKYHNVSEEIQDEQGKHECYGYQMICSPFALGYKIDKKNNCKKFQEKDGSTFEEVHSEWWNREVRSDKTTKLLASLMEERYAK